MPKILDYNTLTTTAGCNVLFIGDKNSSITNPEIKNITVDNLFKRETFYALNANGITFYDDGSNVSLFIKDGGNIGIGGTTANYSLQVNGDFYVTGGIYDCNGSAGSADQYLKSEGSSNYVWTNISTLGGGTVNGSGTADRVPKWSNSTTLGDSVIYDVSSKIGVCENTPATTFHVTSTCSGSDVILENALNGSVLELRINDGSNTDSLFLSNISSVFSLGRCSSANICNVNINDTGQIAIRSLNSGSASLVVDQSAARLIGDFSSSNSDGSVLYFRNTNNGTYSNVISYSNNDGAQKVNWITGTFEDSGTKYFGVHYKNVNISESASSFDQTLSNNLFYINTAGCAYLYDNITTHSKPGARSSIVGHNKGRFVQVFPFALCAAGDTTSFYQYYAPFGIDYLMDAGYGQNSDDVNIWGKAPYIGCIVKVDGYFKYNSAGGASQISIYASDFDPATDTPTFDNNNAGIMTSDNNFSATYTYGTFSYSTKSSSADCYKFDTDNYISLGMCAPSGQYCGNLTVVYEFDIT